MQGKVIKGFNLSALGQNPNIEIKKNLKSGNIDLNDGLSQIELAELDKNKNKVIELAEFFSKFEETEETKEIWNSIANFAIGTKGEITFNADGSQSVAQKSNNNTLTNFDVSGTVTSIVETKNGITTTKNLTSDGRLISSEVDNDKAKTKTFESTGIERTTDKTTEAVKNTAKDASVSQTDKNGNLTEISTKIGAGSEEKKYSASIEYDSNNMVKSVKVNGETYTDIDENDKILTVKDKNGNLVLSINKNSQADFHKGFKDIHFYDEGQKSVQISLNSDNEPESVYEYYKDGVNKGQWKSRHFCDTGIEREYGYSNGQLSSSIDYVKNNNGLRVKASEQTYIEGTGLFASRTDYDNNGNIKSHKTYTYSQRNSMGERTVTVKNYKNKTISDSNLISSTIITYDKYDNKKSSKTGNKSTIYNYDVSNPDKTLSKNHLVSTITKNGNKQNTTYYKDGIAVKEETVSNSEQDNSITDNTSSNSGFNLSSMIKAANITNEYSDGYLTNDEFLQEYGMTKNKVRTMVREAKTGTLSVSAFEAKYGFSKSEILEALSSVSGIINRDIDEIFEQGYTGDCYLLAGINSLSVTPKGREIIKDSIKVNDDGSVTVTFKGADKSYTVTKSEIERYDTDYDDSDAYSNGDNDMLVLEIAYAKYRMEEYNKDINGGFFSEVAQAFTGKATEDYSKQSDIDRVLDEAINNNNIALCFGLGTRGKSHSAKQINGKDFVWNYGSHGFSITKVTEDTVTFINPWDSSEPITMSRSEFKKLSVSKLQCVDLNNIDVDNIQPYQMSEEDARDYQNSNLWEFTASMLSLPEIKGTDNNIKLEFLNAFKAELEQKNGKIDDIKGFVDAYAADNNLDDYTIEALYCLAYNFSTEDNKINILTLGKEEFASEISMSDYDSYQTVKNLLKSEKSIESITNEIINSGVERNFNAAELKIYISSLDKNNDDKITDNEYTDFGIKVIDAFIKQIEYEEENTTAV